jgi:hypothetical protein
MFMQIFSLRNYIRRFIMTTKVNGAAYPGVWVERKVAFVKLVFSKDIAALAAADLTVLGTATAAGAGTVATSVFAVVESAMVQALKVLETRATVLAVSKYDAATFSVDIMLGNAEGWFAPLTDGVIATALPVSSAQAVVTTAGAAPTNVVGALVSVTAAAVTFDMKFAAFDGTMPDGTGANGTLVNGPGATSGAFPMNSPTGTPGWYPISV